jgi:hypothetical protein
MGDSFKKDIIKLRKQGLTYDEIKNKLGCSKGTISYHCKNAGLDNYKKYTVPTDEDKKEMQKIYDRTKSSIKTSEETGWSKSTVLKYIEVDVLEKLSKEEVMKRKSNSVIYWRKKAKKKLVEYKGGKCQCCGYDKCIEAMEFHHLDPSQKDFSISGKSWAYERLRKEVDKCIMVCSNCHKEIHAGIRGFDN